MKKQLCHSHTWMKTPSVHEPGQEVFINMDRQNDSMRLLSPQAAAPRKLPLALLGDSKEDFTEIQPMLCSYTLCFLVATKEIGAQSTQNQWAVGWVRETCHCPC